MADRGFGSTTSAAGPPVQSVSYDRGFGSPAAWMPESGDATADDGFGSPAVGGSFAVLGATDGPAVLPDEGGVVVELSGTWSADADYQVRLVAADGTELPPAGGCYSARAGGGDRAMANGAGDTLVFATPPAPPGVYGLIVRWGPGYSEEASISAAVLVVRRLRAAPTYRLRRRLQPLYTGRGPVSAQRERLLE